MKKTIIIILGVVCLILLGLWYIGSQKKDPFQEGEHHHSNLVYDAIQGYDLSELKDHIRQTLGKEVADKYDEFYRSDYRVYGVKLGGKYGLIDAFTGKEITSVKYDDMWLYENGLISVKLGEKWGILNFKGEEITPLKYDDVGDGYTNGFCVVNFNGQLGYLNEKGEEITPFKYSFTTIFSVDGFATVGYDGKYGFIDPTGKEVVPLQYDFADEFRNGFAIVSSEKKYNLLGVDLKPALAVDYDYIYIDPLEDNLLAEKEGLHYSLYRNGREIIPVRCEKILEFDGVLGQVEIEEDGGGGERYIYNHKGTILYLDYENAKLLSGDFIAVRRHNHWGVIDTSQRVVVPFIYHDIRAFEDGFFQVEIDKKWGVIDKTGKEIFPVEYEYITPTENHFVLEKKGGNNEIYDKNTHQKYSFSNSEYIDIYNDGQFLISFSKENEDKMAYFKAGQTPMDQLISYHRISIIENPKETLLHIEKNKQWGVVTTQNEEIFPPIYDEIHQQGDYFIVKKDEKWGLYNRQQQEILPIQYEDIYIYYEEESEDSVRFLIKDHFLIAKQEGKYGLIDLSGKIIIPFKYEAMSYEFSEEKDLQNLISVSQNGRWGYIDFSGKTIVPTKYDGIDYFVNGLAGVTLNDQMGLINSRGEEILAPKYDNIDYYNNNPLIEVQKDKKWGVVDSQGREIVPIQHEGIFVLDTDRIEISLKNKQEEKISYIVDNKGKFVANLYYKLLGRFSEGLAIVKNPYSPKYGFINKNGKIVIPCKYDDIDMFHKGYSVVKLNGKFGLIDKTGKEVVPIKYDSIYFDVEKNGYECSINGQKIIFKGI